MRPPRAYRPYFRTAWEISISAVAALRRCGDASAEGKGKSRASSPHSPARPISAKTALALGGNDLARPAKAERSRAPRRRPEAPRARSRSSSVWPAARAESALRTASASGVAWRLCNGVCPRLLGLARGLRRHGFRRGRCGTPWLRLACGFCGRGFRQCRNGSRGADGRRLRLARAWRVRLPAPGKPERQRSQQGAGSAVHRAGFTAPVSGAGDRGALWGRRLLRERKSRCAECNRESSGREDKPANYLKSPLDRSIASKKMRTIPVVAILVRSPSMSGVFLDTRGCQGASRCGRVPRRL